MEPPMRLLVALTLVLVGCGALFWLQRSWERERDRNASTIPTGLPNDARERQLRARLERMAPILLVPAAVVLFPLVTRLADDTLWTGDYALFAAALGGLVAIARAQTLKSASPYFASQLGRAIAVSIATLAILVLTDFVLADRLDIAVVRQLLAA